MFWFCGQLSDKLPRPGLTHQGTSGTPVLVHHPASDSPVRSANHPTAPPVTTPGNPSTVTVIRLVEGLQRIVRIDVLNDFDLLVFSRGVVGWALRPNWNIGRGSGIRHVYAQGQDCGANCQTGKTG